LLNNGCAGQLGKRYESNKEIFMKLIKKAIIGSALAFAFSAAQAAPITVGGVTWDPDYVDNTDADFITEFKFTQWFGNQSEAAGVAPDFSDAVTIGTVMSSLNGSTAASGYFLKGAGEIDRVNGLFSPDFCSGCELTYAFGGIGLNKNGTFDITNAWARLFVNSLAPNYSTPAGSQAEVNDAVSGSKWLDLEFTSLGFQSGGVQNGQVSATLEVIGGAASGHFQPKTLSYTADAFFNPGQKYSSGGNGSMIGNTVPEPGTLALFGLGLLGASALRRRNTKA
jgi:hypothetical protein